VVISGNCEGCKFGWATLDNKLVPISLRAPRSNCRIIAGLTHLQDNRIFRALTSPHARVLIRSGALERLCDCLDGLPHDSVDRLLDLVAVLCADDDGSMRTFVESEPLIAFVEHMVVTARNLVIEGRIAAGGRAHR
jgi:hypothetical protein